MPSELTKEETALALKIGTHVLNSFNKWTKDRLGRYLKVPAKIPLESRKCKLSMGFLNDSRPITYLTDWYMHITVDSPTIMEIGPMGHYKHLDLKQALERINQYENNEI